MDAKLTASQMAALLFLARQQGGVAARRVYAAKVAAIKARVAGKVGV